MTEQMPFAFSSITEFEFETYELTARRADKKSDIDIVEFILRSANGAWVCGSFFYSHHMPTARNRISELRQKHGADAIASETCKHGAHRHRSRISRYRWTGYTKGTTCEPVLREVHR